MEDFFVCVKLGFKQFALTTAKKCLPKLLPCQAR